MLAAVEEEQGEQMSMLAAAAAEEEEAEGEEALGPLPAPVLPLQESVLLPCDRVGTRGVRLLLLRWTREEV